MEKVKILCVGIGGYANIYLESLIDSKDNNFEIVGLVDIFPEGCRFLEKLKDIPLYETIEDFYKENSADLAIITTPIHLHTRQILCALNNGSNVMCEKPLSGVSNDEIIIEKTARKFGKFVSIGFQWSFSSAIINLKNDILNCIYGKPKFLKSIVLWPRPIEYYNRGSGWAGKLNAPDGTVVNDSVANNATAHYLHNMLYVTGDTIDKSSEVLAVQSELIRVNNIENFDTAVLNFSLDCGAKGLFIASHSTKLLKNPCFEYRFENGTISYDDEEKNIIGKLNDGTIKNYGNPFEDINKKIFDAINGTFNGNYVPPCSHKTAASQVRCIEKVQKCEVYNANKNLVNSHIKDENTFLYVEDLDNILIDCYKQEKTLTELDQFKKLVEL